MAAIALTPPARAASKNSRGTGNNSGIVGQAANIQKKTKRKHNAASGHHEKPSARNNNADVLNANGTGASRRGLADDAGIERGACGDMAT